jgi:hypothetical protein
MWSDLLVSYHDKLKAVTSACLQANPDLAKRIEGQSPPNANASDLIRAVDIKLLLMMDISDRRCMSNIAALSCWWNPKKDALSCQSDECIGFLYDAISDLRR